MLTQEQIDSVGIKHEIHPRYRSEFLKLANKAVIDNRRFSTRLCTCKNYQDAFNDIMELLKHDSI
jgi:hypothetical protein